jgi:hypothetical protein
MGGNRDLILDDSGRVWRTGSQALMDSLRIGRRDYDLTRYLIRNLGFVRFRTIRTDACVTLHPRFLTRPAYESLIHLLVSHDCDRTIIERADVPNRVEIIPGVEDAAARLADLATAGGQLTRADFFREELSLQRLRDDRRLSALSRVMRRWRSTRGELRGDFAATFGDPALRGRTMVIRFTDDLRGAVEYAGDGFTCFDPSWRSSVLGHDMSEQPDPQYGQQIATAYVETHVAQSPHLEFVEAVIRVPGCSARRSRYERLLLPWRRDGARFVSAVSVLRTSFTTVSSM